MERTPNPNRQAVELNRTSLYPLWLVATIAGLGVIAVLGLFFYGAYAGLGSSM